MQFDINIVCLLAALLDFGGIGIGNRQMLVAAWTVQGNYHDAAYPGKCTIRTKPIIVSSGRRAQGPDCSEILCGINGDATILGCGVFAVGDGCKLGGYIDKNAPYPKCCERHVICN